MSLKPWPHHRQRSFRLPAVKSRTGPSLSEGRCRCTTPRGTIGPDAWTALRCRGICRASGRANGFGMAGAARTRPPTGTLVQMVHHEAVFIRESHKRDSAPRSLISARRNGTASSAAPARSVPAMGNDLPALACWTVNSSRQKENPRAIWPAALQGWIRPSQPRVSGRYAARIPRLNLPGPANPSRRQVSASGPAVSRKP